VRDSVDEFLLGFLWVAFEVAVLSNEFLCDFRRGAVIGDLALQGLAYVVIDIVV
jgi:hypothetical protein